MLARGEAAKPQHPCPHRHHSVTHSQTRTNRPPGPGARGGRERVPPAKIRPGSSGSCAGWARRPPPPRARVRQAPPAAEPTALSSRGRAGKVPATSRGRRRSAWASEPACALPSVARPPAPQLQARPPGPLCARWRGAPAGLAPAPGTKGRAAGDRRPAGSGLRSAPAGPTCGRGPDRGPGHTHLPWNQSLHASHSIMKRVTS